MVLRNPLRGHRAEGVGARAVLVWYARPPSSAEGAEGRQISARSIRRSKPERARPGANTRTREKAPPPAPFSCGRCVARTRDLLLVRRDTETGATPRNHAGLRPVTCLYTRDYFAGHSRGLRPIRAQGRDFCPIAVGTPQETPGGHLGSHTTLWRIASTASSMGDSHIRRVNPLVHRWVSPPPERGSPVHPNG
jgi:hypothetical protein